MKKLLFLLFACIIGLSAFAKISVKNIPAKKVVQTENKVIKNNFRYPVTAVCPCGGTVTIYSSCSGTVEECAPGWNAAIEAACGCSED